MEFTDRALIALMFLRATFADSQEWTGVAAIVLAIALIVRGLEIKWYPPTN